MLSFHPFLGFPPKETPSAGLSAVLPGAFLHVDSRIGGSLTIGTGNDVTAWADQSGNGNNLTSTAATHPQLLTNGIGSQTVISVPDASAVRHMDTGTFSAYTGTTLTLYVVGYLGNLATFMRRGICLSDSGVNETNSLLRAVAFSKTTDATPTASSTRNSATLSTVTTNTNPHVFVSRFDGTNHTLWVDSSSGTPVASSGAFGYTMVRLWGKTLTPDTNTQWVGAMGQILLYHSSHSDAQVSDMITFLRNSWGI